MIPHKRPKISDRNTDLSFVQTAVEPPSFKWTDPFSSLGLVTALETEAQRVSVSKRRNQALKKKIIKYSFSGADGFVLNVLVSESMKE